MDPFGPGVGKRLVGERRKREKISNYRSPGNPKNGNKNTERLTADPEGADGGEAMEVVGEWQ